MNEATLILPFDCETTGLVSKKLPLNDPSQPHLVSLSALQVRPDDLFIQQSMSKVVFPETWDWDDSDNSADRAFQVHKLKMDYCERYGRDEKQILDEFLSLWGGGKVEPVAHNLAFDKAVIACAITRYYGQYDLLTSWLDAPGYCTMQSSKDIVNARTKPNAKGVSRLKNPNLKEAYEFFTGETLEEHHSANRDAVACLQIWVGIQEHGS